MPSLPSSLGLTNIPDGAVIVAADHRNNYNAVQTALNSLLTILAGGSAGQVFGSGGGTTVAWGLAGPGEPVTTLPGSPADGQQALLTDSTSAPTYAWLFQWSATASKWLFIGGSPGFAEVTASEATASGTYAALGTAGPSFTVPRAGVYEVAIGFETVFATSAEQMFMSYDIGGTGAVDADASIAASGVSATAPNIVGMRARQKTIAAPATALVAKYKVGNAVSESFQKRWLRVTPVAVT